MAFSPERLTNIRRMRKARRLYKQTPLFAFAAMQEEYPLYTFSQFLDDLRRRTEKKKKRFKTPLARYGRYRRIQELMTSFLLTQNWELALRAKLLRQRITQPYRLLIRLKGESIEYSFSALIPIQYIERLTEDISKCKTEHEIEKVISDFEQYNHLH